MELTGRCLQLAAPSEVQEPDEIQQSTLIAGTSVRAGDSGAGRKWAAGQRYSTAVVRAMGAARGRQLAACCAAGRRQRCDRHTRGGSSLDHIWIMRRFVLLVPGSILHVAGCMAASCAKLQGLPCTKELHARKPVPVASGATYKFERFLDVSAWRRRSSRWALQRDRQLGAASPLNIAKHISLQILLLLRQERLAVLEQQLDGASDSAARGGSSAASAADMARAAVAEARAALARQQEAAAEVHSLRQEAESYSRPVTPMRQISHRLACWADKVLTLSLSWDDATHALQTRQQAPHWRAGVCSSKTPRMLLFPHDESLTVKAPFAQAR